MQKSAQLIFNVTIDQINSCFRRFLTCGWYRLHGATQVTISNRTRSENTSTKASPKFLFSFKAYFENDTDAVTP
jgi:hypothetical protein